MREKKPKIGTLMDFSRDDVLTYMSFPPEHWPQIASTIPLKRVNRELKRRSDVIGILPNDEWTVVQRYMSLETLARITEHANYKLPAVAA